MRHHPAVQRQWSGEAMNAPAIDDLDAESLTAPLAALFELPTDEIEPRAWRVERLSGGAGNPVSAGLHLVSGRVGVGGEERDFALVLKIIHSPAKLGLYNFGESDDERHWNHWRREAHFYRSDLPGRLPEGIVVPRCYRIEEWDDEVIWLWIERISGRIEGRADQRFVAHGLGRLNGRFAEPGAPPDLPWLGRDTHRQFAVGARPNLGEELFDPQGKPAWEHPFLAALFPPGDPYRRYWLRLDALLALLDTLPRTWCHGDGNTGNFGIRSTPDGGRQLVAFDWALTNIGVLGADVAQLIYMLQSQLDPAAWDDLVSDLVGVYLAGLRAEGWSGSERQVWRGYALTVLAHYGAFWLTVTGRELELGGPFAPREAHERAARFLRETAERLLDDVG